MALWDPIFETYRDVSVAQENIPLLDALDEEWKEEDEDSHEEAQLVCWEGGERHYHGSDARETTNDDESEDESEDDNEDDNEDEDGEDGENYMSLKPGDTIRNFMRGGGKSTRQRDYLNQAQVVEGFCKGAKLQDLEIGSGGKPVAFLDDMTNKPLSVHLNKSEAGCQRYRGPLNNHRLLKELRLQVRMTSPRAFSQQLPAKLMLSAGVEI
jgi:hypothetical protein